MVHQSKKMTPIQISGSVIAFLICTFVALICLLPIYCLFVNATRSSHQILTGVSLLFGGNLITNFKSLFDADFPIFRAFLNSCIVSFSSTALCLYFSCLTAYVFRVYNFRFKKFLHSVIILLIIIPGQLGMIGFYRLVVDLGMLDTYWPLILPAIASASTVFFFEQYMKSNFSMDYVDAARVDGANEFQIFNLIALPILKPALATMGLFGVISSWNSYMGPLMFLSNQDLYTLPLLVSVLKTNVYSTDYGAMYLGIALTILPLMIVYAVFSKWIMDGIAMGGIKE